MKKRSRRIAIVVALLLCVTSVCASFTYAKNTKKAIIKLSKKTATITVGKKVKLKLKNAKAKNVKWSSSNKKIATVKKGLVFAKKAGKVTITARYRKKNYKAKITVVNQKKKKQHEKETSEETTKPQEEQANTVKCAEFMVDEMYDGKNIIVSPASLNITIGMVANGASEKEKKDCETFLGSSLDGYNQKTLDLMNQAVSDKMLRISNGIWYKSGYQLNQDFENNVNHFYKTDIFASPMDNSTLNAVNGWADEKTDGMIKKILDDITEDTRVILADALLFIGEWAEKFTTENVSKENFTDKDGNTKSVEMMHGMESVYYENDYAVGFEKKYIAGRYSFVAILPKKSGDFNIRDLDVDGFLKTKTNQYKVQIRLPKFTYEWKDEGKLTEALKKTGLKSIFDYSANPLGNMFANATDSIYVSDVKQSCKIILNESGTKAAAVTVAIVKENSIYLDPSKIKQVYLNRPFAYIIKDNTTDEVLFMGKVVSIDEQ